MSLGEPGANGRALLMFIVLILKTKHLSTFLTVSMSHPLHCLWYTDGVVTQGDRTGDVCEALQSRSLSHGAEALSQPRPRARCHGAVQQGRHNR